MGRSITIKLSHNLACQLIRSPIIQPIERAHRIDLGGAQGVRLVFAVDAIVIKPRHQVSACVVIDWPERGNHAWRSSVQKGPSESDYLVTLAQRAQSALAGGNDDHIALEIPAIDLLDFKRP